MAESVGSLADKLSIVDLKLFHMREQAERTDATLPFRTQCFGRIEVLEQQRQDLAEELTALLADFVAGTRAPKIYRQFKMYNDPQYRSPVPATPVG